MKNDLPAKVVLMAVLVCLVALVVFFAMETSAGSVEAAVTRAQHEQPGSFHILATAPWLHGQVVEYAYRVEGRHTPQTGLAVTEDGFWLVNNVVASGALTGVTHTGVRFFESCVNSWCYVAGTASGKSQVAVHDGTAVKLHNGLFAYRTNNPQNLPA